MLSEYRAVGERTEIGSLVAGGGRKEDEEFDKTSEEGDVGLSHSGFSKAPCRSLEERAKAIASCASRTLNEKKKSFSGNGVRRSRGVKVWVGRCV